MTDKELAVLGQLSPQDYLLLMQTVWAQVTVLPPGKLGDREVFLRFSGVLNELETLVVVDLKSGKKTSPVILQTLEKIRKDMDVVCRELLEVLNECDRTRLKMILPINQKLIK